MLGAVCCCLSLWCHGHERILDALPLVAVVSGCDAERRHSHPPEWRLQKSPLSSGSLVQSIGALGSGAIVLCECFSTYPLEKQCVIFVGKQVKDGRTLADCWA